MFHDAESTTTITVLTGYQITIILFLKRTYLANAVNSFL
jgi:hypothetical protein